MRFLFRKFRPYFRPGREASLFRRRIVAPVAWLGLAGFMFCVGIGLYFTIKALTFPFGKLEELPQRTLVFDRKGKELGYVAGHGENRVAVDIENVAPNFIKALLAREDNRFYKHGGVDFRGVARAVIRNLKDGDVQQGASTITMQLARNTWGLRQQTLARKLQEVALAQRLERRLTKDEILEHYMNRIYFGYGLYGIERASQGYFMKSAADLTLSESAMLAGVIRGPSLLNPFKDLESAKTVRNEVLDRLIAEESITKAEADAARAEKVSLRPVAQRTAKGNYVVGAVHDLLGNLGISEDDIAIGSLRIYTTIDPDLQNTAQLGLDAHLRKVEAQPGFKHPNRYSRKATDVGPTKYVQGAVVTIDNSNGAILAMVGGRDFSESSFNRALEAERQCGSTFKPFVYAAAFDKGGLLPGTWVSDDAIRVDTGDGKVWSPSNSDGTFKGFQPAAYGLISSRNTMTVRVGEAAGLQNVQALARALEMGEIPNSPVSYLGAFETTLMTITSAYSTFPARGQNHAPYLIDRIENVDGFTIFESKKRSVPVLRESVAWLTSDVLKKVMESGTGSTAKTMGYNKPSYGKTGTTNDYRDAWFVGYTDKITTGVWVGLDQPQTIVNKGYGSTLALPVWVDVMKKAETVGFPAVEIPTPVNMRTVELCRACGGLETRRSEQPYRMDLPADLVPRYQCPGHGSRGGLFDLFSRKDEDENRNRQYPNRNGQDNGDSGSVGKAIRGIGRFLFGPSQ